VTISRTILSFAKEFSRNGYELYLVGGAVRDLIQGKSVTDYDFATDATPEEVQRLFRRVIPTGIQHGTVTVRYRNSSYEVTTYRVDGTYSDNRRPDSVTFTPSLAEDLKRRDFTINAIALDPLTGTIIDPHNGVADIHSRTVRSVGDPARRFNEDALRILRAVRFSCRLQFSIEPETADAIPAYAARLKNVSVERIGSELEKIMSAEKPSVGWQMMLRTGILAVVLPELVVPEDIFDHLIASADCTPPENPVVRWAALLHDTGKPATESVVDGAMHFPGHENRSAEIAETVLSRLRFPTKLVRRVRHLVAHHMFDYEPLWSDAAVRRFIRRIGVDSIDDLISLRLADHCGKTGTLVMPVYLQSLRKRVHALTSGKTPLSRTDLAIDGNDLVSDCGIPRGPKIGIILEELLQTCLDDPSQNDRETLITIARKFIARNWADLP